jgi:membrane protease YdiL (CAAX protease family)
VLFAVKNRLGPTLLTTALLVAAALALRAAFDLTWRLEPRTELLLPALLAMAAIGASDGLLFGLLRLALGKAYGSRYRALVEFFRPQSAAVVLAAGVLAAAEELLFRGVLLEGLRARAGLPPAAAVVAAAVPFGLCHLIPRWPLVLFAVWAVWEGLLLGGAYVLTDSLLVGCVLHALHDVVGFSVFAYQRRTGWLLGE